MTRALLLLLAMGLVGCGDGDAYWRGYADGVRQSRAITDAFTLGYSAAQEHGKPRAAINDTIHGNVMNVADTTHDFWGNQGMGGDTLYWHGLSDTTEGAR